MATSKDCWLLGTNTGVDVVETKNCLSQADNSQLLHEPIGFEQLSELYFRASDEMSDET